MEMVEGKDCPCELGPAEFNDVGGKTCGLLLRMLKPIFYTGHYVVLDSGFCVLQAIVALKEKGVFSAALIKKRRYWPTLVPGDHVLDYFKSKVVGTVDAISGILDNVKYTIWCMKEPDYVMQIMATAGLLCSMGGKEVKRVYSEGGETKTTTFQYTKPFEWHFRYRHAVDDHNNLRHAVPSIEGTWLTDRWPICVFAYLLSVTEINAYLTVKHFVYHEDPDKLPKLLHFRRELAWQMFDNSFLKDASKNDDFEKAVSSHNVHDYAVAPHHVKYYNGRVWVLGASYKYQQYQCKTPGCKQRCRHYCVCNPGVWLCSNCHIKHCIECVKDD